MVHPPVSQPFFGRPCSGRHILTFRTRSCSVIAITQNMPRIEIVRIWLPESQLKKKHNRLTDRQYARRVLTTFEVRVYRLLIS